MKPTMIARHGDVGLIRVEALPEGAKAQKRKGDIILERGEATGHAHRVKDATVRIFVLGDTRYMVIARPTEVVQTDLSGTEGRGALMVERDLHGPIVLAPGTYIVRRERSYVRGDVPRVVAD